MRRRVRRFAGLGALLLLVPSAAWALWTDGAVASAQYSSASLAAPSGPSSSPGACVVLVGDQIIVSWTATASAWADGYEIARSTTSGGPYAVIGSVAQPTTVFTDGPLAFSSTYFYVVRATKHSWRSPDTTQVSRTTRSALCL